MLRAIEGGVNETQALDALREPRSGGVRSDGHPWRHPAPGLQPESTSCKRADRSGAPNKWLLNPLFAIYNLLTGAFGLDLFMTVRASRQTERWLVGSLGALALVFEAV